LPGAPQPATLDDVTNDPDLLDRSAYHLVLEDDFEGDSLDERTWLPFHLPHWSSRRQSAARFALRDGTLRLRIDADQQAWCPEFDGQLRVSSLQTAVFSGPGGSAIGQHGVMPGARVREEQPFTVLFAQKRGLFELRAKALADPDCMVAFWMIGLEDEPERSGEICICEIFGREVGDDHALVGMGVHPFGDPALADEFEKLRVDTNVREFHEYAAEWTPERVHFYVDGRRVRTVEQSPDYPMQLMLGLYEFRGPDGAPGSGKYPKEFVVDWVRVYRPDPTGSS
jgi:hypothetical protein